MDKTYTQPFRYPELYRELQAAGVPMDTVVFTHVETEALQGIGSSATLTFDAALEAPIDAVFAAHNVSAIDAARAAARADDDGDRQQARDAVASLTVFIDTFATLTAARRNDALLLALRCIRLLIRVLLRRGVLA